MAPASWLALRRVQGAHSIDEPSIPASIARTRSRSTCNRPEERRDGDHSSHSCQPSPTGGSASASRNLPATTSSIISDSRIVSSFAVSSQASQPHAGKTAVHHRPARTLSPGNVVKVTPRGAAFESRGTSLTLGRATSPTSNSLSRPWPSTRSTSTDACSCVSNVSAKSCRERNRSGFVTRE
jgi:hypothetical protein